MSREQIRQAFKTAIGTVFSGQVYTSRLTDNRNDSEWINIFLTEVDITNTFSGRQATAELAIKVSKLNATDEQLDAAASQIEGAIPDHADVLAEVRNPILQRVEYDSDAVEVASITLVYKIIY